MIDKAKALANIRAGTRAEMRLACCVVVASFVFAFGFYLYLKAI